MLWLLASLAYASPMDGYIVPPWTLDDVPADANSLIGQVWDVRAGHFIAPTRMMFELRGADYVLLGEDHDNPSHHAFQAELVKTISSARRVVAFQRPDHVAIMDAGYRAGSHIVRAVPPGDLSVSVMEHGEDDWVLDVSDLLPLADGLDDGAREILEQDLFDAACGELSDDALAEATEIQVLEDAWMARALLRNGRAILVTDTLHARSDVGVARYVDGETVTVLLRAVDEREDVLFTEGADFIWFTPPGKRRRPCR